MMYTYRETSPLQATDDYSRPVNITGVGHETDGKVRGRMIFAAPQIRLSLTFLSSRAVPSRIPTNSAKSSLRISLARFHSTSAAVIFYVRAALRPGEQFGDGKDLGDRRSFLDLGTGTVIINATFRPIHLRILLMILSACVRPDVQTIFRPISFKLPAYPLHRVTVQCSAITFYISGQIT